MESWINTLIIIGFVVLVLVITNHVFHWWGYAERVFAHVIEWLRSGV